MENLGHFRAYRPDDAMPGIAYHQNDAGMDWYAIAHSKDVQDLDRVYIGVEPATGVVLNVENDVTAMFPGDKIVYSADPATNAEPGMLVVDGVLREAPAKVGPVILFPADLWRRATEEEAEQIEGAMAAQPARLRNLFRSASTYQSDDPLWPVLTGAATQLFGPERAAVLLAASNA